MVKTDENIEEVTQENPSTEVEETTTAQEEAPATEEKVEKKPAAKKPAVKKAAPKAEKKPASVESKSTKPQKQFATEIMFTDASIMKFINYLMKDGKRTVAHKIFVDTMKEIQLNGHPNPQAVLETAIENASPDIMVKSKRIGGAVYQVPMEVKQNKKLFFATKWILDAARGKKGKPMHKKLAEELLAAYSGQGPAIKRKEEVHRMAEANKAFAYLAKYVK